MPNFATPKGFTMPQDAQPGKPFQAVGTFMDKGDGTLDIIELDGAPIEGYEDEAEEAEEAEGPKIEIEMGKMGGKKKMQRNDEGTTEPEDMMARAEKMGLFK